MMLDSSQGLGKERPWRAVFIQGLAAVVASLAYLSVGNVRAWAATGVPSLRGSWGDLDTETASWVVSLPPLGAMLGSALSSFSLSYSRRGSLFLSGFLFLLSFSLIGLASPLSSTSLVLAGRFLSGVGVGLAVPSAAIYVAEIAAPELRGQLCSLPATGQALGVLLSYSCGLGLPWHHLAWASTCPPMLLMLSLLFLPDTPSHLARKGRREAAAKSLAWFRAKRPEDVLSEVAALSSAPATSEKGEKGEEGLASVFSWSTIHPLLLTLYLHLLQNCCGVNVIVFKTVSVFQSVGSSLDPGVCTAVVGGVQLLATAGSILLVDRAGRRPLLVSSCLLTSLSMGSLAVFLTLGARVPPSLGWLPLASIIGSFLGYSLGLASLPYVLMGELLPARTRSLTSAFSSTFNLACLFLILKFYTSLTAVLGLAGVFWLFTGVSLSGVVFVLCLLPETKGRSLQEIEGSFKGAGGRSRGLKEAGAMSKGLKEAGAMSKGLKEAGARSKGLHSCKGELSLHSPVVVKQTSDPVLLCFNNLAK